MEEEHIKKRIEELEKQKKTLEEAREKVEDKSYISEIIKEKEKEIQELTKIIKIRDFRLKIEEAIKEDRFEEAEEVATCSVCSSLTPFCDFCGEKLYGEFYCGKDIHICKECYTRIKMKVRE